MPSREVKGGFWTRAEKDFARDNASKMAAEEIAKHLGRSPSAVRAFLSREGKDPAMPPEAVSIKEALRASLAWKKLKDEFTTDELAYFEEEYVALLRQFKDDVLKTEEQQIRKAITLDIFMRRVGSAKLRLIEDITRLDDWQRRAHREYKEQKAELTEDQRAAKEEFLLNLETQLSSLRAAEAAKTREYNELDNRHQKLMEALKATRDQRFAKVESSRETWLGVLTELADEERRGAVSLQMRLMEEATAREQKRLGRHHVYGDGQADRPLLSEETVKDDEEE